jgi:hypothetical protein
MTFHINKVTVKEFAEACEDTIGSLELDELWRMEMFMQKMPTKIQEEFQRQGNRPKWRSKTWTQLRDALIEADEEIRNPDPIFNRRESRDIPHVKDADEFAKRERRIADELAKVKRERDQFKEEVNVLREGSKRWANSEDAQRPTRPRGSGSPLCWNCWERGHLADSCTPRKSWAERESLRIARELPAPPEYARRKAEYEEARVHKKRIAMMGAISDAGSDEDCSHLTSLVTSGEPAITEQRGRQFTAAPGRRQDLPDSVHPAPRERSRGQDADSDQWSVEPLLRSARVPVPLIELSKTEPFGSQIRPRLFSSPVGEHEELGRQPRAVVPPRGQDHVEESDGEEEDASRRNPGRERRAPERFSYGGLLDDLCKVRNMSDSEFEEYMQRRHRPVSPAIKLAAWVGNLLFQDVLCDIGADCNLMDMETAKKIVACTPGVFLRTDRNDVTITGVAGRTNISAYIILSIDLGQGVVAEDMIYVVERVFGAGQSKMLLGNPFLAVIDAMIGVRHDYLCVPTQDGPPVIIKGRQYLGGGKWADSIFPKSKDTIVGADKPGTIEPRGSQCEKAHRQSEEPEEDDDGCLSMHPWLGAYDNKQSYNAQAFCTDHFEDRQCEQKGVATAVEPTGWSGTEAVSAEHFTLHVVQALGPDPFDLAAFSVEGSIPIGSSHALHPGPFAG